MERLSDSYPSQEIPKPFRLFILSQTKQEVGCNKPRDGQHPHFRIPLGFAEERLLANLSLQLIETIPKENIAVVAISQIKQGRFSLQDIYMISPVLHIGEDIELVLRRIRKTKNNRVQLQISAPKNIDIHSKDHKKQKQKSLAA